MWIAGKIEDNFVEKLSMWITFSRFLKDYPQKSGEVKMKVSKEILSVYVFYT